MDLVSWYDQHHLLNYSFQREKYLFPTKRNATYKRREHNINSYCVVFWLFTSCMTWSVCCALIQFFFLLVFEKKMLRCCCCCFYLTHRERQFTIYTCMKLIRLWWRKKKTENSQTCRLSIAANIYIFFLFYFLHRCNFCVITCR